MYPTQDRTQYYKSMGHSAHVLNADPHTLISLLIKQARNKVNLALTASRSGDLGTRTQSIHRSCAIIDALHVALDPQAGGDIARNLEDLYSYIHDQLLSANASQDDQPLNEVDNLLATLQDGWQGIADVSLGAED